MIFNITRQKEGVFVWYNYLQLILTSKYVELYMFRSRALTYLCFIILQLVHQITSNAKPIYCYMLKPLKIM